MTSSFVSIETNLIFNDLKVQIDKKNKLGLIQINRPKRKNALSNNTYTEISNALKLLDNNSNINIVIITGTGDWYSSGNDLKNFQDMALLVNETGKTIEELSYDACVILEDYINTWLTFKKPLILSDLDDTFFQTARKMNETGRTPERMAALDRELKPRSFMTKEQVNLVDWLLATSEVIPINI